ncbi:hypothetical protein [Cysteiniphilum halobium]|uniref:hypothetical protein n=1 Tax=Cysteiniphilum halobium TaxID=2219059 RepID=UPI003F8452BE
MIKKINEKPYVQKVSLINNNSNLTPHIAKTCVLYFDKNKPEINISIEKANNKANKEYLENRDLLWAKLLKKHTESKLWNGSVLCCQSLLVEDGSFLLSLNTCEYKDILFKKEHSVETLKKQYGDKSVATHLFTAVLPITNDGYVLLGRIGDGTIQQKNMLDIIGGTLNIEDAPISDFEDIKNLTKMELFEETNIAIESERLKLLSLNFFNGCGFFLFTVTVDNDVKKDFKESRELNDLVWEKISDLNKLSTPVTDELKFVSHYLSTVMDNQR